MMELQGLNEYNVNLQDAEDEEPNWEHPTQGKVDRHKRCLHGQAHNPYKNLYKIMKKNGGYKRKYNKERSEIKNRAMVGQPFISPRNLSGQGKDPQRQCMPRLHKIPPGMIHSYKCINSI